MTSPSPSPSASTKPSFRSRVGSLIRRSSLIRPGSPSLPTRKKSSASISGGSSLSGVDANRKSESISEDRPPAVAQMTPSEQQHLERLRPVSPPPGVPSPIAEVDSTTSPQAMTQVEPISVETIDAEQSADLRVELKEPPSATNADPDPLSPRIIEAEDGEPSRFIHNEPESLDELAQAQAPSIVETQLEQNLAGGKVIVDNIAEEALVAEPTTVSTWPDGSPVGILSERDVSTSEMDIPKVSVQTAEDTSLGKMNETSVAMLVAPHSDPFADPPSPISYRNSAGGFSINASMPEPQIASIDTVPSEGQHSHVVQPSPKSGFAHHVFEGEDLNANENQPLLSGQTNPSYSGPSMPIPVPHVQDDHPPVSPTTTSISSTPSMKFLTFGWIPYLLPNGRYYYVQPVFRATTDIELKNFEKLEKVMSFLKDSEWENSRRTEVNCEIYLWADRKVIEGKLDDNLRIFKVDHHRRFVTLTDGSPNEEDLDKEYLYWLFLESHPAHTIPVQSVHQDAVDLVCWCLSDSLLQTPLQNTQNLGCPFSKAEAGHLSALLRSFEDGTRNGNTPSIAHTRLLSRIFARVLEYRQATQRPSKPLPSLPTTLPSKSIRSISRTSRFFRVSSTFLVCFLALGIPYVFSKRSRFDEEATGFRDTSTPSLMLGATVCLVAAVLLTASVSFLSLPGLDNIPRIAILVASLFASFAMISTVFTIFRLKADLETAAIWLGGNEDLLMISNRTILLSLPIVFLAYSIIAFVVGIVLYTFYTTIHQVSEDNAHPGPHPTILDLGVLSEPGNRWVTLGVVGALAGVMFATVVMLRN